MSKCSTCCEENATKFLSVYVQESVHLPKPILCKEQSTTNKLNFFELLSVLLKHFSMKKYAETRKFRARQGKKS